MRMKIFYTCCATITMTKSAEWRRSINTIKTLPIAHMVPFDATNAPSCHPSITVRHPNVCQWTETGGGGLGGSGSGQWRHTWYYSGPLHHDTAYGCPPKRILPPYPRHTRTPSCYHYQSIWRPPIDRYQKGTYNRKGSNNKNATASVGIGEEQYAGVSPSFFTFLLIWCAPKWYRDITCIKDGSLSRPEWARWQATITRDFQSGKGTVHQKRCLRAKMLCALLPQKITHWRRSPAYPIGCKDLQVEVKGTPKT